MSDEVSSVRVFFEQYARARSARDVISSRLGTRQPLHVGIPNGARPVEKASLLAVFPNGLQLLKTHGHTSTNLRSLDETVVDEHYRFVRGSSYGVSRSRGGRQSKSMSMPLSWCTSREACSRLCYSRNVRTSETPRERRALCWRRGPKTGHRRSHRRCLHEGVVVSRGRHNRPRQPTIGGEP